MGMLIELATIGVQCTKNANVESKASSVFEHSTGGTAKELVEQGPVVIEKRPKQVRHRESDMLPFAIWQNMPLLGDPLFGAFEPTRTASFGFTGLTKEARMRAFRRRTAITSNAHRAGATGEHLFNTEELPFIDRVVINEAVPSVVILK